MMQRIASVTLSLAALAAVIATGTTPAASSTAQKRIERGRELVFSAGCNDCHTPKKMGPDGPELDTSLLLAGNRESPTLPPPPVLDLGAHGAS